MKKELVILACDPASAFGWAISKDVYGTWDMSTRKDESYGMKLLRLEAKLDELHQMKKLDVLVFERPAGQHKNSLIMHGKLVGILERWAEKTGVEYRGYSASEIKKFGTGKGNAGKPIMISAAKNKYGYAGFDDNEADALHLLHLAKRDLNQ